MTETAAQPVATLHALKSLTNAEMDSMSDEWLKHMLKEIRALGLIQLRNDQIDAMTRQEAVTMLAEARHDAQVNVNG